VYCIYGTEKKQKKTLQKMLSVHTHSGYNANIPKVGILASRILSYSSP